MSYKNISFPKPLIPLGRKIKLNLLGLSLFSAFLIGRVPWHGLRLFVYRYFFGIKIGRKSVVHWRARFYGMNGIRIGEHTIIGNDAFFDGRYGLTIGNRVNIAGETAIFTAQHDPDAPDFKMVGGAVEIDDYVYIGSRVTILPGVKIGKGAVVATGAVVVSNVEPYTMVGGVPAHFIKNRNRDLNYQLDFHMPFQ